MITIKIPGLKQLVRVESIVSIEGDGNYSILHFDDGQHYTAVETLKWFEDQLADFLRLHKHRLINPLFVSSFDRQTAKAAFVTMRDGTAFPVARRRIGAVSLTLNMTTAKRPDRILKNKPINSQLHKNGVNK